MYTLVKFVEDNIFYVTPSRGITPIEGKLIWAPYKRMGFYEANVIAESNDKNFLSEIKRTLMKKPEETSDSTKITDHSANYVDGNDEQPLSVNESDVILNVDDIDNLSQNGSANSTSKKQEAILPATTPVSNEEVVYNQFTQEVNTINTNYSAADYVRQSVEDSAEKQDDSFPSEEIDSPSWEDSAIDDDDDNNNSIEGFSKEQGVIFQSTTYVSDDEELYDHCTKKVRQNRINESTEGSSEKQETNYNIPNKKANNSHKKHQCFYCKKQLFQIVRHWNSVHNQETEIKEINSLHPSNPLRRQQIDLLRKKGDYEYNVSVQGSSSNHIVSRVSDQSDAVYVPCSSCLGYFNKKNIRKHKIKCSPNNGSRHLQGNCRKLTPFIHDKASSTLRNFIASDMYDDNVTKEVFSDQILITYGNYMCIRVGEFHNKDHIRAQLRLLGRFMLRIKMHDNNIRTCKDLIHSRNIDTISKAINDIAKFDETCSIYKHPTNARTLLNELKKIIGIIESESDRTEDDMLMRRAAGLSRRIQQELAPYINRICKNSENRLRRLKQQKNRKLPQNIEIKQYLKILLQKIASCKRELEHHFSLSSWTDLVQTLMVYLAVFNRKRPGETQRIEIADFYNREGLYGNDLMDLDDSDKIQAKKYTRISFRGKLGNSTALLIDKKNILPGIELILKYRESAGIHPKNRFLFGKPSKTEQNLTFDAYKSHRRYCKMAGISCENLTFTKLRKHFATEVAKAGTSQEEERRVSTYMSHDFDIHKKVYDHSATLIDITKVSKHLEQTMECKQYRRNRVNDKSFEQNKEENFNNHMDREKSNYKILKNRTKQMSVNEDHHRREPKYFENINCSDSDTTEEPSLDDVEKCLGKFRKRKLWSSEEKKIARHFFREEINRRKHIKLEKLTMFKKKFKHHFKHRSINMIKQWVEREKIKFHEQKNDIQGKRPRYSTPEKELLQSSLEQNSLEGIEPSLEYFEGMADSHEIFKKNRRSAESLQRKYHRMRID